MVILSRTYDLLAWVLPRTEKFPRLYRNTITRRLLDALLDFQELLYEANAAQGSKRLTYLRRADGHLDKLRLYLRLAFDLQWLTSGQYEHVSRMVEEVGRLLGGWIRESS
ncbi:MAG: diversity-generating retroelement protein Avd [Anaerolineales bacterium]|nr:diversity-generating retroelement protein Avd [Anaerolineales bacterium]